MPNAKVIQTARLDNALELAVTQNWSEFMSGTRAELVHIEYQTDDHGSLEFLKVWDSDARGHWDLICEIWLRALWSNVVGMRFANDYSSPALAHALDLATADGTSNSYLPGHHRLIQVYPPNREDQVATGATPIVNPAVQSRPKDIAQQGVSNGN